MKVRGTKEKRSHLGLALYKGVRDVAIPVRVFSDYI